MPPSATVCMLSLTRHRLCAPSLNSWLICPFRCLPAGPGRCLGHRGGRGSSILPLTPEALTQIRSRRPCAGQAVTPSCLPDNRPPSPLPVRMFEVWYPSNRAVTGTGGGSSRTVPPQRTRSSAATPQTLRLLLLAASRFVQPPLHFQPAFLNSWARQTGGC